MADEKVCMIIYMKPMTTCQQVFHTMVFTICTDDLKEKSMLVTA